MTTATSLPKNANHNFFNLLGALAAVAAFFYCRNGDFTGAEATIYACGAYGAVILALEVIFLRTPWRDSVGLDFSRWSLKPHRLMVKLVGLYGSVGFVALLYWLFPEYHGSFYNPFREALNMLLPAAAVLSVPYMAFMDARMRQPEDSYYHFGRLLLLDWSGIEKQRMAQHLLGWVVKGFFLPLMFVSMAGNMNHLMNVDLNAAFTEFKPFYRFATDVLFTLDLLAAVAGYSLALRLFDTHIRSSEPTLFGWFICIMCYQPFLSVYMRYYLTYSDNNWMDWLNDSPVLQIAWGSLSLVLLLMYTIASINFGVRFSNLTHRGVLTGGMYRFTKHPAYVCKNAFWWMIHVPFLPTQGWWEALRYCLLLLGINTVYFLRARTEEAHLSRDPDYVAYALAMNERSVFARLGRLVPFLRYRAPKDWQKLPKPYEGIK